MVFLSNYSKDPATSPRLNFSSYFTIRFRSRSIIIIDDSFRLSTQLDGIDSRRLRSAATATAVVVSRLFARHSLTDSRPPPRSVGRSLFASLVVSRARVFTRLSYRSHHSFLINQKHTTVRKFVAKSPDSHTTYIYIIGRHEFAFYPNAVHKLYTRCEPCNKSLAYC